METYPRDKILCITYYLLGYYIYIGQEATFRLIFPFSPLSVACRKRPPPPVASHHNALRDTSQLPTSLLTLSPPLLPSSLLCHPQETPTPLRPPPHHPIQTPKQQPNPSCWRLFFFPLLSSSPSWTRWTRCTRCFLSQHSPA
jgi:hypothetical protein